MKLKIYSKWEVIMSYNGARWQFFILDHSCAYYTFRSKHKYLCVKLTTVTFVFIRFQLDTMQQPSLYALRLLVQNVNWYANRCRQFTCSVNCTKLRKQYSQLQAWRLPRDVVHHLHKRRIWDVCSVLHWFTQCQTLRIVFEFVTTAESFIINFQEFRWH